MAHVGAGEMKEVRVKHQAGTPRKIGVVRVKGVEKYVVSSGGPATTILAKEERGDGSEAALYMDARVGGRSAPLVLTSGEVDPARRATRRSRTVDREVSPIDGD